MRVAGPVADCGAIDHQQTLLRRLESQWRRSGCAVQRYETHISWIYVVDQLAYKFKKALRFDVLDYSTLAARRHCCDEELRLNGRLAPTLYLGVAAVTDGAAGPEIDGAGAPLEYAVRMRAFPQQALWSARLQAGLLGGAEIDALALRLARFHAGAAVAAPDAPWGRARALDRLGRGDLVAIAGRLTGRTALARLRWLTRWHAGQMAAPGRFTQRHAAGRVRECHGDLHSGNILTLDGRIEIFDGIEFNPALRWIDVISDVAFIFMDLRCHGRADLAARLLEGYLAASDDYRALSVFAYYRAMRALVRCKVQLLRAEAEPAAALVARAQAQRYLWFACADLKRRGALVLMHGYSGSGKSYCAARLACALGAVRLRSDVERKRLRGLDAAARMAAAPGRGIYDGASTAATYARLRSQARAIVGAGLPVVIDAANLLRWQRRLFERMAKGLGLSYFIIDIQAGLPLLQARLAARARAGDDASDAGPELLAYQFATQQPLSATERRHTVVLDSEASGMAQCLEALARRIEAAPSGR